MPNVLNNGVTIYHEIHGKGFPLILAHGLGANTGEWRYQTPELSKGYRLILWDQRGHGQSDSPPQRELYGRDTSAEDLLFLMDHLRIPMAYVGGTSLGGGVAAAFTVAHPERVAALLVFDSAGAGGIPIPEESRAMRQKTIELAETQGMAAMADYILEANPNLAIRGGQGKTGSEINALRERFLKGNPVGYANTVRSMLTEKPIAVDKLAKIEVSTLVLGGGDDPSPSLTTTHARITGSKMVTIPNAGHLSNMDQPEVFNREVLMFLGVADARRIDAATRGKSQT
ncbi:MAG: alpha/beta hydrolase [Chloroflexi bacterium]|nr:alpha/beta hydrolase [Chloroflexota bacterium]